MLCLLFLRLLYHGDSVILAAEAAAAAAAVTDTLSLSLFLLLLQLSRYCRRKRKMCTQLVTPVQKQFESE